MVNFAALLVSLVLTPAVVDKQRCVCLYVCLYVCVCVCVGGWVGGCVCVWVGVCVGGWVCMREREGAREEMNPILLPYLRICTV